MSKRPNKQLVVPETGLITPSAIETHACSTCGALLPQPIGRLDDIPGQAHLRRAVAVALVGKHSITFIGVAASLPDALTFGRISRRYNLTAYATTACMCGNTGDPYRACECTPEALIAWRARPAFRAAIEADLVVEASVTSVEQRIAYRHGRRGETDEQLLAQAAEARRRSRPDTTLDMASERLLAAAIRQLQLSTEQVTRLLTVAQSVAQLSGVGAIGPVQLAEALQYRSRLAATLELIEPGSEQEQ